MTRPRHIHSLDLIATQPWIDYADELEAKLGRVDEGDKILADGIEKLHAKYEALRERYDALETELQALREAAQWISVSERKPEKGQEVWAKIYTPSSIYDPSDYIPERGVVLLRYHSVATNRGGLDMTHWMPSSRPEPPTTGAE